MLLVGRATTEVNEEKLPFRQVAIEAARNYIGSVCSHLDARDEKQLEIDCRIGQGSVDLRGVFDHHKAVLSNDTSFGVGFAPFSDTEQLVLETRALPHHEAQETPPGPRRGRQGDGLPGPTTRST